MLNSMSGYRNATRNSEQPFLVHRVCQQFHLSLKRERSLQYICLYWDDACALKLGLMTNVAHHNWKAKHSNLFIFN